MRSSVSIRAEEAHRSREKGEKGHLFHAHFAVGLRVQSVLRDQIDLPPEKVRQLQHQPGVVHQIDL